MDIKAIELDRSNKGEKVRIGPGFISAAKDVVGGTNGHSGKLGGEVAMMMTSLVTSKSLYGIIISM